MRFRRRANLSLEDEVLQPESPPTDIDARPLEATPIRSLERWVGRAMVERQTVRIQDLLAEVDTEYPEAKTSPDKWHSYTLAYSIDARRVCRLE